jgi:hypothetical protein
MRYSFQMDDLSLSNAWAGGEPMAGKYFPTYLFFQKKICPHK